MAQPTSPFQSFYRLIVMVGTLGVGSMAAYLYGPPPDKLADLIDQGMARIAEMQSGESASSAEKASDLLSSEPPPFVTTTDTSNPRIADPLVQSASTFLSPPNLSPGSATPTGDKGESQLLEAGAAQASVEPWGIQGKAYRATASMPIGVNGMTRQFDAIAETAEQATQEVLTQVQIAAQAVR